MATIANLPNGKFKAIIRKDGRILKTKTFQKKSNARTWAKRIEADQEALYALGLTGTKITLKKLAREYRDGNSLLELLVKQIGPAKIITDITVDVMRDTLNWFMV